MQNNTRVPVFINDKAFPVAVINCDQLGKIISANNGAELMFGYEIADLTTKNIREIFSITDANNYVIKLIDSAQPLDLEADILRKDGTQMHIQVTKTTLTDGTEKLGVSTFVFTSNELKLARARDARQVLVANSQLTAIMESLDGSIYALDTEFKYLSFNEIHKVKMLQDFGASIVEGENFYDVIKNDARASRIKENIEKAFLGERTSFIEKVTDGISKAVVFFENRYSPLFNTRGIVIGVTVFSRDVTENQRFQQELITAKDRAEEGTRARQSFLARMSHEMRTPLNAVIGFANLIAQENTDPSQNQHLATMLDSAEHLLQLINDVLDINKFEDGKMELEQVSFNLQNLLQDTLAQFKPKAEENNLYLKLINLSEGEEAKTHFVNGDPFRLRQVFNNLISNALKFTHNGGIKVTYQFLPPSYDNQPVRFSVEDTGIGISPDKKEVIFESFMQANTETTRRYGGSGLGLSITQKLLELKNSHIELISELGKGSIFAFVINFTISDIASPSDANDLDLMPTDTLRNINNRLKDKRVLLVEDDEINTLVALRYLEKWGLDVSIASNGLEAVNLYKRHQFPVILMDLYMPVLDGIEATKQIRSFESSQNIAPTYIIALTAAVQDVTRLTVKDEGVSDILIKPFNPDQLQQAILAGLSRLIVTDVKYNGNEIVTQPNDNVISIDTIKEIGKDDIGFLGSLLPLYAKSLKTFNKEFIAALFDTNKNPYDLAHKIYPSLRMLKGITIETEIKNLLSVITARKVPLPESTEKLSQLITTAINEIGMHLEATKMA